jgi:biotin---protein ligase
MATKQLAEELRGYARSERHLRLFQEWADALGSVLPIQLSDSNADAAVRDGLFPRLKTTRLGGVVLFSPALASTQTLLHETLAPPAPAGVVCYTAHQLSGKGRGTNTWVSPEGCLTFSFRSAFSDGNSLPFVQYLCSLAIVKAARAVHSMPEGVENPVRIKWPNDIYAHNVKIGGMLCQSEYRDQRFTVTTGVGINISNREPTQCLRDVLSTDGNPCTVTKCVCFLGIVIACFVEANRVYGIREEFLAAFLNIYEEMETEFMEKGFAPFLQSYLDHWLHKDQVVQVASSEGGDDAKVPAVIKGLTATGCLLAEGDRGEKLELYPDGNSFDFLSGLLKRKL